MRKEVLLRNDFLDQKESEDHLLTGLSTPSLKYFFHLLKMIDPNQDQAFKSLDVTNQNIIEITGCHSKQAKRTKQKIKEELGFSKTRDILKLSGNHVRINAPLVIFKEEIEQLGRKDEKILKEVAYIHSEYTEYFLQVHEGFEILKGKRNKNGESFSHGEIGYFSVDVDQLFSIISNPGKMLFLYFCRILFHLSKKKSFSTKYAMPALKSDLGCKNQRTNDFTARVLEKAIKEINSLQSYFTSSYKLLLEKKIATHVEFTLEKVNLKQIEEVDQEDSGSSLVNSDKSAENLKFSFLGMNQYVSFFLAKFDYLEGFLSLVNSWCNGQNITEESLNEVFSKIKAPAKHAISLCKKEKIPLSRMFEVFLFLAYELYQKNDFGVPKKSIKTAKDVKGMVLDQSLSFPFKDFQETKEIKKVEVVDVLKIGEEEPFENPVFESSMTYDEAHKEALKHLQEQEGNLSPLSLVKGPLYRYFRSYPLTKEEVGFSSKVVCFFESLHSVSYKKIVKEQYCTRINYIIRRYENELSLDDFEKVFHKAKRKYNGGFESDLNTALIQFDSLHGERNSYDLIFEEEKKQGSYSGLSPEDKIEFIKKEYFKDVTKEEFSILSADQKEFLNEEIKSYISAELNLKEIEANVEDLKNNKIRRVFLEVQKTRKVWRENPLSYEEFLTALFNIRKGKKMFFYQGPRLTSEEQAYQEKKTEESSINSDLSYELEGLLYEMYPKHLKKYESLEEEKVKKQKKEAIKVEKEKEVALLEKQAKDYERSKNSRTKNLSSIMDGLKGNR